MVRVDIPVRVLEELVDVLTEQLGEVSVLLACVANETFLLEATGARNLLLTDLLHLSLLELSLTLLRIKQLRGGLAALADARAERRAHV